MNKFCYVNKKFLIAILFVVGLLLTLSIPLLGQKTVLGEENNSHTPTQIEKVDFAPNNDAFVFDVTTPVDAISFGDYLAVIKKDETSKRTLWISADGNAFIEYDKLVEGNPGQIKALGDKCLIVLDNTNLYVIDCSNPQSSPIELKYNDKQVNCKSFDLNDNYLVTNTNGVVNLYSIYQGELVEKRELNVNAKDLTPICVNLSGTVFYIENSTPSIISSYNSNFGPLKTQLYTATGDVSHMIANDQSLFIIEGDKVKVLNGLTEGQSATDLLIEKDVNNDLGNLTSPASLSFMGDTLFIADSSICAVQQFEVQQDALNWTGFAIAKNKTAYNRFTDSICDVERTNDNLAVLTDDRIVIINLNDFDYFNEKSYLTLYKDTFGNQLPEDIAVGNSSLLTTSNLGDYVYIYDFNAKNNTQNPVALEITSRIDHIHDCCYQSGYYYLLISVDNQLDIYKINEITKNIEKIDDVEYKSNPIFTVDVYGNFHVYSKDDGFIKLETDLTGSIFAIKNDGVYKLINQDFVKQFNNPTDGSIKSFTMDFDKKDVYYITENSEIIYKASHLYNDAIDGTATPSDYTVTDSFASENSIVAYAVNAQSNVYSITEKDGKFYFNKTVASEDYYLFVCDIDSIGHSILIGQDGLVLVAKSNLNVMQLDTAQVNQLKYISTSVCAYYYPIIDEFSSYALTNLSGKVTLSKGQEIHAIYQVEILGNSYYFATFENDGQTVSGYVPTTFTVEELSVDVTFITFTIETLKGVDVYTDVSLKHKATTLSKGTTIRLYSIENGVAKIAYFDGENWIDAYASQSAIEQKPNTTIRNVLIILALTACICGSITFFVLRKKED